MHNTGYRIASVVCDSLTQRSNLTRHELEEIIYPLFVSVGHEQVVGDWLELPNGATYTLTFKPARTL